MFLIPPITWAHIDLQAPSVDCMFFYLYGANPLIIGFPVLVPILKNPGPHPKKNIYGRAKTGGLGSNWAKIIYMNHPNCVTSWLYYSENIWEVKKMFCFCTLTLCVKDSWWSSLAMWLTAMSLDPVQPNLGLVAIICAHYVAQMHDREYLTEFGWLKLIYHYNILLLTCWFTYVNFITPMFYVEVIGCLELAEWNGRME